jgi:hemerythrin-like domain-containing protein
MDICQALKRDHRRMLDLIARLRADDEGAARGSLQSELIDLLADHARGEETLVYPALGRSDAESDAELAAGAREEHEHLDQLVDDLVEFEIGEDGWEDRLEDLEHVLKAHLEVEEGQIFSRLEMLLSREEARNLGRAFTSDAARGLGAPLWEPRPS